MTILEQSITRNTAAWNSVKEAIIAQGQDIPTGTPVEEYAQKISSIAGDGGTPFLLAFSIDERGHLLMSSEIATSNRFQINFETGHLEYITNWEE